MPLDAIAGRSYGPYRTEVSADKVAELVAATGDDGERWRSFAPPGFAATALFAVASSFFDDPDVAPFTGSLIQSEQHFRWLAPLVVGAELVVSGHVESVRSRRSLHFVSFVVSVAVDGADAIRSESMFVMSEREAAAALAEDAEPAWGTRGPTATPTPLPVPAAGQPLQPLPKSASRADLVRYAGATRDFNPIHWDHGAAVAAGLSGVIAHGLLMGAWVGQAAARVAPDRPDPLAETRVRFKKALRPAVATEVRGDVESLDGAHIELKLVVAAGDDVFATGTAKVRRE